MTTALIIIALIVGVSLVVWKLTDRTPVVSQQETIDRGLTEAAVRNLQTRGSAFGTFGR